MDRILVVGSLAYDDIETPFDRRRDVLGGAASYSSIAASLYAPVDVVGVVGDDFRAEDLARIARRGADLTGVERRSGRSFHWSGRYGYELGAAETLATDLGVFGDWRPTIPERPRENRFVFLANIDPEIQLETLAQMRGPEAVVLDTMNFWIEHKKDAVLRVLERVDIVSINDAEARQLCGGSSLLAAAREILTLGPKALVIKRGEHGATLFTREGTFWAPAVPLEALADPTGAGDSFAGGMVGYLARCGRLDDGTLRRAVLHGIVCASFAVETFSVDGVEAMTTDAVAARYRELRRLVAVEAETLDSADDAFPMPTTA